MTYNQVKQSFMQKGYEFREQKMALNLFGIRTKESQSDKFDDIVGCAFINESAVPSILSYAATTDPGKHWLQNPMRKEGCAILVPGQYKEVYSAGKHQGKYEAFVQTSKMFYVRDNNKDALLDFSLYRDPEKYKKNMIWDIIGSNIHRASEWNIINFIGQWSASCQVVQDPKNFKKLIEVRDRSVKAGFTKFDYTLFEEL